MIIKVVGSKFRFGLIQPIVIDANASIRFIGFIKNKFLGQIRSEIDYEAIAVIVLGLRPFYRRQKTTGIQ